VRMAPLVDDELLLSSGGRPPETRREVEGAGTCISAQDAARLPRTTADQVGSRVIFRISWSAGGLPAASVATPPAHCALAEAPILATTRRRAWHRPRPQPGTHEDIAAEMERSAGRAKARGGLRQRRIPGKGDRADAGVGCAGERALAAAKAGFRWSARCGAGSWPPAESGQMDELQRDRRDCDETERFACSRKSLDRR